MTVRVLSIYHFKTIHDFHDIYKILDGEIQGNLKYKLPFIVNGTRVMFECVMVRYLYTTYN